MRFATTAFLTIYLLTAFPGKAVEPAQQQKKTAEAAVAREQPETKKGEQKSARGKRFLRSVGSFGAGMLLADPYSDPYAAKKAMR